MRTFVPVLAALSCLVIAAPAAAHIQLMTPAGRNAQQKKGPCGLAADQDMKGAPVATYAGGETITVVWQETVNHPSHYRISLDLDGQDDFVDPAAMDEFYSNDAVLLDEIPDKAGGMYEAQVELPDVSCDTCTLQLIQVMYDKPPFPDGNDMYYQCADIVIEGSGVETTGSTTEDPTTGDPSTSGTAGTTAGTTGDPTTGDPTDGTTDGTTGGGSSSGSATGSDTGSASESAGPTAGSGDSAASTTTESATDSGASDDDVGCGCVQGSSGGAPWMAFGLLAVVVRRRRRC